MSYLEKGLTVSTFNTKQFYIQANKVQESVGFVTKGLLRSYYVNDEGKEITVRFIAENDFATNYVAFITLEPSKFYTQCIEPCEIVNISYSHMQDSYSKYYTLERYGRLIAEEVLKQHQKRIESFLFENAEECYLDFIKTFPKIYNRISISYLSSYLGIERQSLTRIRKKISKNQIDTNVSGEDF
ncbi:Crp/Fnr family transcriptional regulator [Flavobacterium macrobrachii]|uniref:Crp/Fnr family transcriptional regulator n=1 Tax=Flavobacterium macrobrachii TaxID=591204 RepID=A0ABS2CSR2_9FLAO|nr:Crp/Fnr family transcriptional regulator [Flavobacterium macrobrachii]MBM6498004.1 Crp/Fnr family transcriptional regulator [Flavobacterium macrobrachii]